MKTPRQIRALIGQLEVEAAAWTRRIKEHHDQGDDELAQVSRRYKVFAEEKLALLRWVLEAQK